MIRLDNGGRALQLSCRACGAVNRIPVERLHQRPVCGRCKAALAVDHPVETTDATFDTLISHTAVPLLVDFWAPWCAPCRMVGPELEKVAHQQEGRLLVAKVNSDQNQRTAARYEIRSIPSLLIFKQGKEVDRLIGAMNADQILRRLEVL